MRQSPQSIRGVALVAVFAVCALRAGLLGPAAPAGAKGPPAKPAPTVVTDFLGFYDEAYAVVAQPDGKVVVAGQATTASEETVVALARYTTKKKLDTTFGGDGLVTTAFGDAYANAVGIQSSGGIVIAGPYNSATDFALSRHSPDGTLDTTFGESGFVVTDFGGVNVPRALAIQPDDKIVVVGDFTDPTTYVRHFALARYLPDGALDTSFGVGGKVVTAFGSITDQVAYAVALQSDGKIVVAGGRTWWPVVGVVARYSVGGTLDTAFGNGGSIIGGTPANAVAIQDDGSIVVAGQTPAQGFRVARYTPSGEPDTTFGASGEVATDFPVYAVARSLAIQRDGKIVAAGRAGDDFAVARYRTDGALDARFGSAGTVVTDFPGESPEEASSVALAGRDIVVVGGIGDWPSSDFALAWYRQ